MKPENGRLAILALYAESKFRVAGANGYEWTTLEKKEDPADLIGKEGSILRYKMPPLWEGFDVISYLKVKVVSGGKEEEFEFICMNFDPSS